MHHHHYHYVKKKNSRELSNALHWHGCLWIQVKSKLHITDMTRLSLVNICRQHNMPSRKRGGRKIGRHVKTQWAGRHPIRMKQVEDTWAIKKSYTREASYTERQKGRQWKKQSLREKHQGRHSSEGRNAIPGIRQIPSHLAKDMEHEDIVWKLIASAGVYRLLQHLELQLDSLWGVKVLIHIR